MFNLEYRVMKNVLDMSDRMGIWIESKEYLCSDDYMSKYLSVIMLIKESLKFKELENMREVKDDVISFI